MRLATISALMFVLLLPGYVYAARSYVIEAGKTKTIFKIIRKTDSADLRLPSDESSPVAFNDGWRWVYRKKVVTMLKDREDTLVDRVVARGLGMDSVSKDEIIKEALNRVNGLKLKGGAHDAGLLNAIIYFYDTDADPSALEEAMRTRKDGGYSKIGEFLLADHNERKGFHPEASGYYSKLSKGPADSFITIAARFRKARLNFFEGKFAEAKTLFKSLMDAGDRDSALWLANTCLVKGEYDYAVRLYKENRGLVEGADLITQMSVADMYALNKEYENARGAYAALKAKFQKEEFIEAFFAIKIGDTYLLEGKFEEAESIYMKTKARYNGEPWAMSSLAIADLYNLSDDKEMLEKALRLYGIVAGGGYLGSEITYFSLISTGIKTGRFDETVEHLKKFPQMYPTSPLRIDLPRLYGSLVYRWIDTLYREGDYQGVLNKFYEYGVNVPFGKKGDTNLKAGRAAFALGLYSEAAGLLDTAIKVGGETVIQEASVSLGRVYVAQSDPEAVERLIRAFLAKYPKTRLKEDAERLLFEAAFINGDFSAVASSRAVLDTAELVLKKASALRHIGRLREAIEFYTKATASLSASGNVILAEAYTGLGDAYFGLERYKEAIDAYKSALAQEGLADQERSWALYRMVQGYEKLKMHGEKEAVLKELGGINNEVGGWSGPVFKEPASL
ncbi:MAG: tetratricopeptide repeat protein [Deltaproteobacteria bacterium]|nr:tetratricopeptide repeat protein [Deltaproteobacteria bacterium]